jgi:hypothetical protein
MYIGSAGINFGKSLFLDGGDNDLVALGTGRIEH